MSYCPNCGSEMAANAKFCPACGYVMANYVDPNGESPFEPGSGKGKNKDIFPDFDKKVETFSFDEQEEKKGSGSRDKKEYTGSPYGASGRSSYSDSYSSDSHIDAEYDLPKETNGFAIASLALGIAGIFFDFILLIPSILAVIFGIMGLNRSKNGAGGYKMSLAGIILGIIMLALWLILLISAVVLTGIFVSL